MVGAGILCRRTLLRWANSRDRRSAYRTFWLCGGRQRATPQVYTSLKLYDRAIAVWKLRIEAAPKDAQQYLGLASVYFAACKIPEVIAQIKMIAKSAASRRRNAAIAKQMGTAP